MKAKLKNFFIEVTVVTTLISGLVSVLAVVAFFFGAADAPLFLLFAGPVFVIGALLLTFVIKNGWQRLFGEAFSGIFQWPF